MHLALVVRAPYRSPADPILPYIRGDHIQDSVPAGNPFRPNPGLNAVAISASAKGIFKCIHVIVRVDYFRLGDNGYRR